MSEEYGNLVYPIDGSLTLPIDEKQLQSLNDYLKLKAQEKDLLDGSPELRKLLYTLKHYAPDLLSN